MGLKNLSIKYKVFIPMMLTAMVAVIMMGIIGYRSSKESLSQSAFNQLISLREARKFAIESYFKEIKTEILTLSESYMTIEAMKSFDEAYHNLKPQNTDNKERSLKQYYENELMGRLKKNMVKLKTINAYFENPAVTHHLQYHYISGNRYPTGKKDLLINSDSCGNYDLVHSKYHQKFSNFIKQFHFYDLFLIDLKNANITYTVMKEVDYATSLATGPYQSTNLAKAFRAAAEELTEGQVKLVDFDGYDPSYGAPASFVATPIFENGKKIGVLALQISIDEIDEIMTAGKKWKESGLGASGETYLVGNDFKMRSNSRFLFEDKFQFLTDLRTYKIPEEKIIHVERLNTTILELDITTTAARGALEGKTDAQIIPDYRNIPVLSAFAPLNIEGVKWAVLAEIDEEEAFLPIQKLLRTYSLLTGGIILGVFFLAAAVSAGITRPIGKIRDFMLQLSTGELPDNPIPVQTKDEIGQMNSAANKLISGLHNAVDFAQEIEKGNLEAPFTPLSDKDSVGNALRNMQFALKFATEMQQQALEEALAQEEELRQNAEELFALNEELNSKQRDLLSSNQALKESEAGLELKVQERTNELTHKNTLLTDSINYAKNIQLAMLPTQAQMRKALPEHFVIYRPKDIVSGDFYWLSATRNKLSIVCADCTGHGVPGAFMSIVGINTLNQIVREYGSDLKPNLILDEVNQRICALLKQGYQSNDNQRQLDGMDVAFCYIDFKEHMLRFAGAGRPLYYFNDGELKCIKGDKLPIGGSSLLYDEIAFTNHEVSIEPGDTIYMFSDGFTDQFNKEDRKKFSMKRVVELLGNIQHLTLAEQGIEIEKIIDDWKGQTPQTDDVLVMGFKVH